VLVTLQRLCIRTAKCKSDICGDDVEHDVAVSLKQPEGSCSHVRVAKCNLGEGTSICLPLLPEKSVLVFLVIFCLSPELNWISAEE